MGTEQSDVNSEQFETFTDIEDVLVEADLVENDLTEDEILAENDIVVEDDLGDAVGSEVEENVPQLHVGTQNVLFTASWCALDEHIQTTLTNRGKVTVVDVDRWPTLAEQYKVVTIPTFVVLDRGVEQRRRTGVNVLGEKPVKTAQ